MEDWKSVRLEECNVGLDWNSERLEGVELEECRIKRVKDWKSVRLEGCRIERVKNWKGVGLKCVILWITSHL